MGFGYYRGHLERPSWTRIDDRRMVIEMYGVPVENVHLTHGATQAISMISATSRGGKVAVEMPSYPLSQTARILGLKTVVVRESQLKCLDYRP